MSVVCLAQTEKIATGNCFLSDLFQQHPDIFGVNSSNLLRLNYIQASYLCSSMQLGCFLEDSMPPPNGWHPPFPALVPNGLPLTCPCLCPHLPLAHHWPPLEVFRCPGGFQGRFLVWPCGLLFKRTYVFTATQKKGMISQAFEAWD